MSKLRVIPSIEQLRQRDAIRLLESRYGRDPLVAALREATEALRREITSGTVNILESDEAARQIEADLEATLAASLSPSLRPVINATGVIIHTNLGRAPLGASAIAQAASIAAGYCNLEYDLAAGARGSRTTHASGLLAQLAGADAALVVNNNAAAVLLILTALAAGRDVIISRGEMVEIGDGFRIPDVMRQSGARLREVGTTNRTRAEDYAAAINDSTALILRVHPSNFRIEGFTERPTLEALVSVGQRFGIPVVEDLGGGNIYEEIGRPSRRFEEPTVQHSIKSGVAVCCFSGDKLLGGPQAGLILGRQDALHLIARHPLMRALRVDKLVYATLEATLLEHVSGRAATTVPVTRMINTTVEQLSERADRIVATLKTCSDVHAIVRTGETAIGGGTAPGTTVASCVLDISAHGVGPDALEAKLRRSTPPVVARIDRNRLLLDLRTVAPSDDESLTRVLAELGRARD